MKECFFKSTRVLKAIDERVTYELIGAWCSQRIFRLCAAHFGAQPGLRSPFFVRDHIFLLFTQACERGA